MRNRWPECSALLWSKHEYWMARRDRWVADTVVAGFGAWTQNSAPCNMSCIRIKKFGLIWDSCRSTDYRSMNGQEWRYLNFWCMCSADKAKQSKAMISRDINNVLVCVLSGCIWDWSDRSAVSYHGSVPVDRMRENHRSMVWYFLLWLHANELLDSLSGAVCFACNKSNKYAHAYTF
jgi:hypothetical protein